MVRPRHSSGNAIAAAPPPPSGTRRSSPTIRGREHLAVCDHPLPRPRCAAGSSDGVSAARGQRPARPPSSTASTSQPGAGSQSAARAPRGRRRRARDRGVALTARIMSASTSARRKPPLAARLQAAGAARQGPRARADAAVLLDGRRARGCRPVPVNRLCGPVEWRIPLSPSIHRKYTTSRRQNGRDRARSGIRQSGSPDRGLPGSHRDRMPSARTPQAWHNCRFPHPRRGCRTMTMLDRMRRHKNWLKWSLAIVVLAFVLLYIPSFIDAARTRPEQRRRRHGRGARHHRRPVPPGLPAADAGLPHAYGANVDERLLKQLGIDQRIVQQMIEEEAALAEATRLGITASDEEVRSGSSRCPAFQENGQFIGDAALPAAAPDAEAADDARRVRGTGAPRHRRREAAGGADRLDHASPTRKSTTSTSGATRR